MGGQKIGERIADLRTKVGRAAGKKLRQEDLAAMVGKNRSAVADWERGEREPDCRSIVALARVFSVSVEELLSGVDGWSDEPSVEWNPDDVRDTPGLELLMELQADADFDESEPENFIPEMYARAIRKGLPLPEYPILDNKRNSVLRNAAKQSE